MDLTRSQQHGRDSSALIFSIDLQMTNKKRLRVVGVRQTSTGYVDCQYPYAAILPLLLSMAANVKAFGFLSATFAAIVLRYL